MRAVYRAEKWQSIYVLGGKKEFNEMFAAKAEHNYFKALHGFRLDLAIRKFLAD